VESHDQTERGGRRGFLAGVVLLVGTFALFARTGTFEFVAYDDPLYVADNEVVLQGLTAEGVRWAFGATHAANWHPLTWLSHMLDVELFGPAPGPHHLVNAGLHALNALLLFLFLRRATRTAPAPGVPEEPGALGPAFLVAALFAWHPLRAESVAWVSERKDVLAGTCFLLALLAHVRYARRPTLARSLPVLLAGAAGMLAKPMLVTLPLILLCLDVWPLRRLAPVGRLSLARLVGEKLPLLLLALGAGLATLRAQGEGDAIRSFASLGIDVRVANAFLATAAYLGKTLWPTGLAVFHPHPALVESGVFAVTGPATLLSASLVLVLTALAFRGRGQRPWLFVGWCWFLVMLLPVLGLVQVGTQWMAERYTYLPGIGLVLALVYGIHWACPREKRAAAFGAGVLACAGFLPATWLQLGTWRDTRTLFEHALAVTGRNYLARVHLGLLAVQDGDDAAAEEHFLEALDDAPNLPSAHNNLGLLYKKRGDVERALVHWERRILLEPRAGTHVNLAGLYLARGREGDRERALAHLGSALELRPDQFDANLAMGRLLAQEGRVAEALSYYERARAKKPNRADVREELDRLRGATSPEEPR
jgi:Flp pilus assembly protein TadD